MSNLLLNALVKKFPSTFPSNIERIKICGPHILFFPSYFPSLLLFLPTKQVHFLISIQTSLPLFPSFHFSTLPNTLLVLYWGGASFMAPVFILLSIQWSGFRSAKEKKIKWWMILLDLELVKFGHYYCLFVEF